MNLHLIKTAFTPDEDFLAFLAHEFGTEWHDWTMRPNGAVWYTVGLDPLPRPLSRNDTAAWRQYHSQDIRDGLWAPGVGRA